MLLFTQSTTCNQNWYEFNGGTTIWKTVLPWDEWESWAEEEQIWFQSLWAKPDGSVLIAIIPDVYTVPGAGITNAENENLHRLKVFAGQDPFLTAIKCQLSQSFFILSHNKIHSHVNSNLVQIKNLF